MNPIFASDLAHMHADFGGAVVWGAYRTTGTLATATDDLVSEDGYAIIRGETPMLVYTASTLPGLKRRDVLQITDVMGQTADYQVNHVDLLADGLPARAYLEKL